MTNFTALQSGLLIAYDIWTPCLILIVLALLLILIHLHKTFNDAYYVYIKSMLTLHSISMMATMGYIVKNLYFEDRRVNFLHIVLRDLNNSRYLGDIHLNLLISFNRYIALTKSNRYKILWPKNLGYITAVISGILSLFWAKINVAALTGEITQYFLYIEQAYCGFCFLGMFIIHCMTAVVGYRLIKSSCAKNRSLVRRERKLILQAGVSSALIFGMWFASFFHFYSDAIDGVICTVLLGNFNISVQIGSYVLCDKRLRQEVKGQLTKKTPVVAFIH